MEHKRSLFGPLLLIAAGVLWLLIKGGTVPSANLWALTHVWPFVLIAAGVGLILRPYWSYTSVFLDVVIIGGLVASILYAPKMGWDNPTMVSFDDGDVFVGPSVRGSGNIIEETRTASGFDSISIDYPATVTITQGNTESLKVKADDDVLPGLKTEVKSGELRIYYKRDGDKRINPTETVKIAITVKDVKSVQFSSAGELIMDGIDTDSLDIALSGAGNIELNDLTAKSLDVNLSGAGSMTASGTADDLSLNISGFGDFTGKKLESRTATINISGAGSAAVRVENDLDATISGAGSVDYYGSPDNVTKHINGVGSVSPAGE